MPFQGQAFFCTKPLDRIERKRVTFLSQQNHLGFDVKVSDFLVMAKYREVGTFDYTEKDYKSGLEFLKIFDQAGLYDRMFYSLSGGEQQLVWLAQTLNTSSEMILLDEPCQGLDIKNRVNIYRLLASLAKKRNQLILCVTHDLFDLNGVEGTLLTLNNKKIVTDVINNDSLMQSHNMLIK